ncbi:MAG TPA: pyrroloquinoline quinone precursor peptide PqqA [Polyangiaceae bacterium]|nr:pyrroloquinoline quinone precursor peptide PqqA [Polyangiaceae bacterium]
MTWETPSFEEIDMSAEIGSYQGEDDDNDNGL